MSEMKTTLEQGLPALGLELPEEICQKLCDFGAAMVKQNEVMNLTAITEPAPWRSCTCWTACPCCAAPT